MNSIVFFFVFLLSGWDCIQQFILQADGAGRIPFWSSLLFLFFLMVKDPKPLKTLLSPPVFWVFIGSLWAIINTSQIGIHHILFVSDEIFFYRVLMPVLLFVYVFYGSKIDQKKCLRVLICSMYMSCLVYLSVASMRSWNTGEAQAMRLSSETLNANFLAFYAVASFFVVLFYAGKFGMRKILLLALGIISGTVVFLSGSRTGYSGFLILIVSFFASRVRFDFRKIVALLAVTCILYYAHEWAMENTDIGARFEMRNYEIEHAKEKTGTVWDDVFGERIVYFILCRELFPQHPYCGIGEYNFIEANYLSKTVCHNEYIRMLIEEGLVGFLLFASFFVTLWWRLVSGFRKYPKQRACLIICAGGILCVMAIYMGCFAMSMLQIVLALCAAEIFSNPPMQKHQLESGKIHS